MVLFVFSTSLFYQLSLSLYFYPSFLFLLYLSLSHPHNCTLLLSAIVYLVTNEFKDLLSGLPLSVCLSLCLVFFIVLSVCYILSSIAISSTPAFSVPFDFSHYLCLIITYMSLIIISLRCIRSQFALSFTIFLVHHLCSIYSSLFTLSSLSPLLMHSPLPIHLSPHSLQCGYPQLQLTHQNPCNTRSFQHFKGQQALPHSRTARTREMTTS